MNYVILNTADSISKKNCRLNQTIVRVRQKKSFILFYLIITKLLHMSVMEICTTNQIMILLIIIIYIKKYLYKNLFSIRLSYTTLSYIQF